MKKLLLILAFFSPFVLAESSTDFKDIADKVKVIQPETFKDIRVYPSLMKGYYQVVSNTGAKFYVNKDVTTMVHGDLIQVKDNKLYNISRQESRIRNAKVIESIKENHKASIVHFPTTSEKKLTKIYVFSDFTCPYCKKLHNAVPELNRLGVDVYYIPFPRNSMSDMQAVKGLQRIICTPSQTTAFNEAFENPKKYALDSINNQNKNLTCPEAIDILNFHNYADVLGVKGTPTIFTENGSRIVGYNNATQFAIELKQALDEEAIWTNKDVKK
jgi:thiol:disulfide interchange protein DsbC